MSNVSNVSSAPSSAGKDASVPATALTKTASDTPKTDHDNGNLPSAPILSDGIVVCPRCKDCFILETGPSWYAVICGTEVGIFKDLAFVESLTKGKPGERKKRFSSFEKALEYFQAEAARGTVSIIPSK